MQEKSCGANVRICNRRVGGNVSSYASFPAFVACCETFSGLRDSLPRLLLNRFAIHSTSLRRQNHANDSQIRDIGPLSQLTRLPQLPQLSRLSFDVSTLPHSRFHYNFLLSSFAESIPLIVVRISKFDRGQIYTSNVEARESFVECRGRGGGDMLMIIEVIGVIKVIKVMDRYRPCPNLSQNGPCITGGRVLQFKSGRHSAISIAA
jgi:hypothetical protein